MVLTLENSGFESQPTNLTTNSTSQFVLLDTKTNVIPGWSFNGTVWYVTAGGNISLPENGHGLQLGPNGVINQTFKTDGSYYYTLTFTLAPSSMNCANNFTAVNVSGSDESKVFIYKESFGSEMWQTYAYSMSREIQRGIMGIQFQSVAGSNDCWPIIDTLLVNGIGSPRLYEVNFLFIPFAFDTFGFLATEAVDLLSRVQRVMHSNVIIPRSMNVVFKRLSFAIQKGVAAQLVARLPTISM
ncbi:hypothetical protein Hanom_Chr16g01415761 [Helianthus anomalus]